MTWIVRGSKPDRNLKAGALGFLEGLVKGIVERDDNPFLRAGANAIGSAVANNPHRLADRMRAKKEADAIVEKVIDGAKKAGPLFTPPPSVSLSLPWQSGAFRTTVARIHEVKATSGTVAVRVFMPNRLWAMMSPTERTALETSLGANLRIGEHDALVVLPLGA